MSLKLPHIIDSKSFRIFRADRARWLGIALDIARGHGLDVSAPHVFATGTNLVVGFGENLIEGWQERAGDLVELQELIWAE